MDKTSNLTREWVDNKLSSMEGMKELFQFIDAAFEPRFTIKMANIKKQELAYWKKEGLYEMTTTSENREWTRVHFFDYVWLKLVSELRKVNMPVKDILKIRQNFFTMNDDIILSFISKGMDEVKNYPNAIAEDDIIDFKQKLLTAQEFFTGMFRSFFLPWNLFVLHLMLDYKRFNLLFSFNGEMGWFYPELVNEPDVFSEFLTFTNQTHVSIPIHKLLDEFYESSEIKSRDIQQVFLLTEKEVKLIKILRTEGITGMKIKLRPDKGGHILVETVHQEDIGKTKLQLDRILNKEGYKDIHIKMEGSAICLFEVSTKMKI